MKTICIIGCGRSGTLYTSMVMKSMGVLVGHEKWELNGGVGWPFALPRWKWVREGADLVVHQVRHPLPTIGSLTTHTEKVYGPVTDAIGELSIDKVERAAMYWCRFNAFCEGLATRTFRVEDLCVDGEYFDFLCTFFEVAPSSVQWPEKGINKRKHITVTLDTLKGFSTLHDRVLALGRHYGYIVTGGTV